MGIWLHTMCLLRWRNSAIHTSRSRCVSLILKTMILWCTQICFSIIESRAYGLPQSVFKHRRKCQRREQWRWTHTVSASSSGNCGIKPFLSTMTFNKQPSMSYKKTQDLRLSTIRETSMSSMVKMTTLMMTWISLRNRLIWLLSNQFVLVVPLISQDSAEIQWTWLKTNHLLNLLLKISTSLRIQIMGNNLSLSVIQPSLR